MFTLRIFLSLSFSLLNEFSFANDIKMISCRKTFLTNLIYIYNHAYSKYTYARYEYAIARTQITYITYEESRQELGGRRGHVVNSRNDNLARGVVSPFPSLHMTRRRIENRNKDFTADASRLKLTTIDRGSKDACPSAERRLEHLRVIKPAVLLTRRFRRDGYVNDPLSFPRRSADSRPYAELTDNNATFIVQ